VSGSISGGKGMATDPERVRLIRVALENLYEGVRQLNAKRSAHYEPGSRAAVEQADPKWSQEILNACSIGVQLFESGGEHLSAFGKTITEPVEAIACWTTIRSMLEPCALATWLFDMDIDIRERAARSFALRHEGLVKVLKYLRLTHQSQTEIDRTKQKIDDTEQKALSLGFDPVLSKPKGAGKRKRIGIGMRMPQATDLIEKTLAKGGAYSLLSAVAHGHFWAISQVSFVKSSHPTIVTSTGVKMATMEKHLSVIGAGFLAMTAVNAFTKMANTHFRYVGVETTELKRLGMQAALRLQEAVNGP
jgi:hypothetical protein